MKRETFKFSILLIIFLFAFLSCGETDSEQQTEDSNLRISINLQTECLLEPLGQDVSTQQVLDDIVDFVLTVTDGFDPIVEIFNIGEQIRVFVPVGNDRHFMIEGRD